jgi:spore coat protein U-like protein
MRYAATVSPLVAAIVVSAGLISPGRAETTKSFPVTAVVANGCVITSDGAGGLGSIALGTTPGTAGSSVQASLISPGGAGLAIECTPGVTGSLSADNGDHPVSGARYLKRTTGTATIPYLLYLNGSSTAWTTGALSLPFVAGTGKRLIPLVARATLPAMTAAGSYSDNVRITVSW